MTILNVNPLKSKRTELSHDLSDSDIEMISEALISAKDSGVKSFSSLEAYLAWYQKLYGKEALKDFLKECKQEISANNYSKLMNVVSDMAQKCNHKVSPEIIAAKLQTREPMLFATEASQITQETIDEIIAQYEQYFDEIDLPRLEREAITLNDSKGEITFAEISNMVSAVEVRLAQSIVAGEITQEAAKELIEKIKAVQVGQFAAVGREEFNQVMTTVHGLNPAEIEDFVEKVSARENIAMVPEALNYEEGFLSVGANQDPLVQNADMTLGEMQDRMRSFEAEIIELVEDRSITSDEAYSLRDKVATSPVYEAPAIQEAVSSVVQEGRVTPEQLSSSVAFVVSNDYPTIVREAPVIKPQVDRSVDFVASEAPTISEYAAPVAQTAPVIDEPVVTTDYVAPVIEPAADNFGSDFSIGSIEPPVIAPQARGIEPRTLVGSGADPVTPKPINFEPTVARIDQQDPVIPLGNSIPPAVMQPAVPVRETPVDTFVPVDLRQKPVPGTVLADAPTLAPQIEYETLNLPNQTAAFNKVQQTINAIDMSTLEDVSERARAQQAAAVLLAEEERKEREEREKLLTQPKNDPLSKEPWGELADNKMSSRCNPYCPHVCGSPNCPIVKVEQNMEQVNTQLDALGW